MDKYIVIYESDPVGDGTFGAQVIKCDYPDSCAPHVWGLPDNYQIIAVIEPEQNPYHSRVWIEETEISLAISPALASE